MKQIKKYSSNKSKEIIDLTIQTLKDGGLVVFPSDTVYGLLVDATNEAAVKKLIAFKNRPPGKPISIFVANEQMILDIAEVSSTANSLLQELLPGPFTIVLPSRGKVSSLLESEKKTIGVRLPKFELIQQLVQQFGLPITATSANLGGRRPHYSAESLLAELPQAKKDLIDLVIDAGQLPHNKPSTIVDLTQPKIKILRHGDIVVKDTQTYVTETPQQTRKLGAYLIEKLTEKYQGTALTLIIQGDLGAGKTVFVKGIAEYLDAGKIISPTYVIYYEYDFVQKNRYKKLYHADLYNLDTEEDVINLGLQNNINSDSIFCFEWGEKVGTVFNEFRTKSHVVMITITYLDEEKREITIKQ